MNNELQHLVDALAQRLRRPIAIDDTGFRLLAYSSHNDDVDSMRKTVVLTREVPPEGLAWLRGFALSKATEPVHLPANLTLDTAPRIAIPVRCQGVHLGCLWLIDDDPITDTELATALPVADQAGEILFRELILADLQDARSASLLGELLSDDPDARDAAAAQLTETGLFAARGPVVAVVLEIPTVGTSMDEDDRLAISAAFDRSARLLPGRECLYLVRPTHGVLVASEAAMRRTSSLPTAMYDTASRLLGNSAGRRRVVGGVGAATPTLTTVVSSYRGALEAARVADTVPRLGPIARSDELGVYGVLAGIPFEGVTTEPDPMVSRLMEADPALLATAELFLDHAGNVRKIAELLSVHRASVYQRLRRIEQITGTDLTDGEQRLALHLGIKLARMRRHI